MYKGERKKKKEEGKGENLSPRGGYNPWHGGGKERKRNMPTSKRSFGLILLHAAVCSVGRKLTSPCLPARNKIRFSARQFVAAPVWAQLANSLVKRFVSRPPSSDRTDSLGEEKEGKKSFHTVGLNRFDFYIFIDL